MGRIVTVVIYMYAYDCHLTCQQMFSSVARLVWSTNNTGNLNYCTCTAEAIVKMQNHMDQMGAAMT